jgi:predicted RNA-binding Zn-ribbon protein involved in translation (DUF1610 family)
MTRYEIYCPECPDCGTRMQFISEIVTDLYHDDNNYLDVTERQSNLFQCPKCKTIKVD